MVIYRYSEQQLIGCALKNLNNLELLELLVKDFGLDVNWKTTINTNQTLLYQAVRDQNFEVANFLISKGACVNVCMGERCISTFDNSLVPFSMLDVFKYEYPKNKYLISHGAISYETQENEDLTPETLDYSKMPNPNKYIYRSKDQLKLSLLEVSDKTKDIVKYLIGRCERIDTDNLINTDNLANADDSTYIF